MPEIPHTTPGLWPDAIPPARFAAHIHQALHTGCRVAILGLPDDLGVRLNGGRPGARDGPRAFREALARYGVAHPHGWDWPVVLDAGDVTPAHGDSELALHETHRRVTEAVAAILDLGLFPIGIGGGHDLTFPFVRAVAARERLTAGVYFDAHLDVRETVGSGMPFRRLVESCGIRTLQAHGVNPMANSREHVDWFLAHGGRLGADRPAALIPPQDRDTGAPTYTPPGGPGALRPHDTLPPGALFASFDLDVLDAAHAPGVSAMNPAGWTIHQAEAWVTALGREPRIRCFDLMELCPEHDEGGRTARIAAHLFLAFLRGYTERPT